MSNLGDRSQAISICDLTFQQIKTVTEIGALKQQAFLLCYFILYCALGIRT